MWTVYILESLTYKRYYIGHSNNIEERLKRHNRGSTTSTKPFRPWKIVCTEVFSTKQDAYRREMEIKSYKSGILFKKLIGTY